MVRVNVMSLFVHKHSYVFTFTQKADEGKKKRLHPHHVLSIASPAHMLMVHTKDITSEWREIIYSPIQFMSLCAIEKH